MANEIIKIDTMDDGTQAVSGRELHDFLEIGRDFTNWMKQMIGYGFSEHTDFEVYAKNGENPIGGRPSIDYIMTIDMAKEISMIQRTEKGKQARQYFIQVEKEWKAQEKPMTMAEIVAANANMIVNHEKQLNEIASRQEEQDNVIKQVTQSVNNISNIIAINNANWRYECDKILGKCAYSMVLTLADD